MVDDGSLVERLAARAGLGSKLNQSQCVCSPITSTRWFNCTRAGAMLGDKPYMVTPELLLPIFPGFSSTTASSSPIEMRAGIEQQY